MTAPQLTAEDRLEIIDLIANYALCIDSGDLEGFLDNFLPDATLESGSGTAEGHAGIREWFLARARRLGEDLTRPRHFVRHFVGIPALAGDGARCTAETYVLIVGYDSEQRVDVPLVGRYEDTIAKVDGRWRFRRRVIHSDLSAAHRTP